MAIDFSNQWTPGGQNALDPNAVAKVEPSKQQWWIQTDANGAWIGAPTNDPKVGRQTGYRSVGTALVTLADGRTIRAVLDGEGKPISEVGSFGEADTTQANAFKQAGTNATPNSGAQTQRQPDGTINQWDPNGLGPGRGGYTIPRPDLTPQKPTTPHVEGTPLPGGGFDNSQPIMVSRDANGQQVGPARPLTADERKQWEEDRQRSRNPGGVPDAQLPAAANITYRKNPQTGQLEKVTTKTVNGVASTTVEPVDPKDRTAIGAKTVVVGNKTTKVTTWQLPDGSTQETTEEDQAAPKPGAIVKGGGKNGEDVQAVEDPAHPGQIIYQPIAGAQIPAANRPIPAGAPKYTPDYNAPDLGLTSYNEELLTAQQSGLITREQGRQLMETAIGLGTQTASHGTTLASQASTTRSQDITQRGQTLSEVQSRRSAADTGFDNAQTTYLGNAAHLGAGKGGLAADAFREAIQARMIYARQAGGYADVPAVPLSPATASVRTTHFPDGTVVHERPHEPVAGVTPALPPPGAPADVQPTPGIRTGAAMTGTGVDAPAVRAAPAAPAAQPGDFPPNYGANTFAPATTPLPAINPATGEPTGLPQPVFNPAPGEPGHVPGAPVGQVPAYLQPARNAAPVFDPSSTVAELRNMGLSDAAINQALQEHQQEMGMAVA